jgi:hypothetical protein
MSYSEMKFRTKPSYYSRAEVEASRREERPLQRFRETMAFAVERFNRGRGKENIVFEIHPVEGVFGRHDVVFYIEGRRENAEIGILRGDLLSIEDLCYNYGSRAEFLHLLPRLSRHLIEKEYSPSMRR